MAPAREPGSPTITDITNANAAAEAEAERKRLEEEKRRKAAENASKGMDPSGRKLKAKDRPVAPNAIQPRKLFTRKEIQNQITTNPISWFRAALRNDGKEGGWAVPKEILRTGDKGFTGVVEGISEFAIWGGLTAYSATQKAVNKVLGAKLPELPKTFDPLEKEYRDILINSMSEENRPQTGAGKLGADVITFALTTFSVARWLPRMGLAAKLTPKAINPGTSSLAVRAKGGGIVVPGALNKLQKAGIQALTGLPSGAAADFMLTKSGDPNFANVVRDLPFVSPEIEDIVSLGLASNRTDNAF